MMPALPPEARTLHGWKLAEKLIRGMLPSLALIFVVLGTILMGLATPTESGAMGAAGAIALAWFNRRLTWSMFWHAMDSTTRLSTMVIFIVIGSTTFSSIFQGYYGGQWIEHLLTGLPGGLIGFLIFVNIFIFILAFFLDFFEIAFIVIPLAGAGRRQARHRSHLVRRVDRGEYADILHASALRLRVVLSARRGAAARSRRPTSITARFPGWACNCCWWRS